jgi:hypothetical protein
VFAVGLSPVGIGAAVESALVLAPLVLAYGSFTLEMSRQSAAPGAEAHQPSGPT